MTHDEKNINETKNVNVHNPVQINIGQSENSLQTAINFIKNLELVKVNNYLKQFIRQYITTGIVVIPIFLFAMSIFITLFIAFMRYHNSGTIDLNSFMVVPHLIYYLFSTGMVVEFFRALSPLIAIYISMLISIYIGCFIASKVYYDDPKQAKALRELLFCIIGAYFLIGFTKHISNSVHSNKKE